MSDREQMVHERATTPRLVVGQDAVVAPADAGQADNDSSEHADLANERIRELDLPEGLDPSLSKPDVRQTQSVGKVLLQGIVAIAIVGLSVATMVWMIAGREQSPSRMASERVYTIETIAVEQAENRPDLTVFGTTLAGQTAELRSLVSGEIVSVHPELKQGHTIPVGSILLQIDPFSYEGALIEARANLDEARARLAEIDAGIASQEATLTRLEEQLVLAQRDLERSEELLGRGSGTEKGVDDRQLVLSQRMQVSEQSRNGLSMEAARADQQRAIIERLEWRVKQAERDLANTSLVAPFNAVVLSENAGIGRNVSASDLLVTLYREDAIEARFVLTDLQFGRLLADDEAVLGRKVEVVWLVGGLPIVYPATIERIGAEVQSDRGGVELFARVETDQQTTDLRPGAFVEVLVPDRSYEDSVRLPETAVYGGNAVFVIEGDRLVKRPVKIAAFTGTDAIVTEGLTNGERILITQIADAREGMKVIEPGASEPGASEPGGRGRSPNNSAKR